MTQQEMELYPALCVEIAIIMWYVETVEGAD
jgi:hypothetical protein